MVINRKSFRLVGKAGYIRITPLQVLCVPGSDLSVILARNEVHIHRYSNNNSIKNVFLKTLYLITHYITKETGYATNINITH